jgi:hypothetical protein
MNRIHSLGLAATLGTALLVAGSAIAQTAAQPSDPQPAQRLTAEQQTQLDHLRQLEAQLRKDRATVHAAIVQYGWDSDQTDAARAQLLRNRQEYRQVRRSLRFAGVDVPPPAGLGRGTGRTARRWARAGRHGDSFRPRHAWRMCHCPCAGW